MSTLNVELHPVDHGDLGIHLGLIVDGVAQKPTCTVLATAPPGTWGSFESQLPGSITCPSCLDVLRRYDTPR